MTYAGLSKGTTALAIGVLVTAHRLGLYEELTEELRLSQPERIAWMEKSLAQIPSKSRRWIGEMEEIARTFEEQGLTPFLHRGAAEMYRFVGGSSLAAETPEMIDAGRTLSQVIDTLGELES
jgi:hypothetical protein